jgi:nucleotide-binding universal stress UspA family protein
MKTILVHYDSESSLTEVVDSALNLRSLFNSPLTFAHITEKTRADDLEQQLKELLRQKGVTSSSEIKYIRKEGKQYVELVNIAKSINAGSIITRAEMKKGFKLFNDNTPYYTVVSAPCPVFTLAENVKMNTIRSIMVPIDTSAETRQKVPLAIQIAKLCKAEIHLVAFGSNPNDTEARTKLQNYIEQSRHFVEEKGIRTTAKVIYGKNTVEMIKEYSKENCDLLVITADEETSIFSSASEKLISSSPIPVLSFQPKDLKVSWAGL